MTTKHFYPAGLLLIMGIAACNNSGTPGTTNPADSTVTTTTTTTVVKHRYAGTFIPKPTTRYIDLKTNKEITVHIDTVRGSIVNDETNDPVDLFVEPITHDTIYGLTGTVVNNYVIHDPSGDLRVDTVIINNITPDVTTVPDPNGSNTGKVKYKDKANGKTKYKDNDEKVKEKNGVIENSNR